MKTTETIRTRSGLELQVETRVEGDEIEVSLQTSGTRPCLLHWGVRQKSEPVWRIPPEPLWPPGTRAAGQNAVQTPFVRENGHSNLVIRLTASAAYAGVDFVLFFPNEGQWDNNKGHDYRISLTPQEPAAVPLLDLLSSDRKADEETTFERLFDLESGWQLAAAVAKAAGRYHLSLVTNVPGTLLLHWGIARRSPHEWLSPPPSMLGANATLCQGHTAQTPFVAKLGAKSLDLEFPEAEAPLGLQFVLKQQEDGGRWLNYRGGNFYIPIHPGSTRAAPLAGTEIAALADEIIRSETGRNSWTLMHRFNLCHDMIDRVRGNLDGEALLYVWMRFSAIRQLTWQRNYNTKPKELAHAQDRLTQKIAGIWREERSARPLARLTLGTVGRGGEGQRIRDEILNIMHRHHVKEVSGHFLEEWHQKLHNNTTPDDVVICEGYLEFLRSDGNLDRFYQTLQASGVTRQRLESFERPIRSAPQFVPHLKNGLLHDFQEFLKILKASHSGTDFETALNAARNQLDGGLQGLLGHLWEHRNDSGAALPDLVSRITEARRQLSSRLQHGDGLRELLYLDLALEQLLRAAIERNIHLRLSGEQLADLIACVLENVTLSYEDPELAACSRHWERLQKIPRFGADWSLHAKSAMDRIARALADWIDRFYQLLQPKAEHLGSGFQAEPWSIALFSEEVVRGGSLGFALSILLHHLDPILRQSARLGDWQVISRGRGAGRIEVVEALGTIQGKRFEEPTVIVADKVMGNEDLPEGVTAVIAPDVTDIVSHVAVRARNANVLFASCYEPAALERLKSLRGRYVQLEVNPAGDVVLTETAPAEKPSSTPIRRRLTSLAPHAFTRYAVAMEDFDPKIVGGKAYNLAVQRGKIPDWIRLPRSIAVPFGGFEKVLALNQEVAKRYEELVKQLEQVSALWSRPSGSSKESPTPDDTPVPGGDDHGPSLAQVLKVLSQLRETVVTLAAPEELLQALTRASSHVGLVWPQKHEQAWSALKQVWASKWNDRAFLSRSKLGIPHADLVMSVLIQEVVPADYAYVIHTVNPSTGRANELLAEVVLGLGETLVGNYPGRALSFVWDKVAGTPALLSYPSKSIGLYGAGLIFRSDSNGEDLAGYAGAGLYDSVLAEKPRQVLLDYTQEPLVWDPAFRDHVLANIARIGLEFERACGSPQDVEGAVTHGEFHVVQTRPQVGEAASSQT